MKRELDEISSDFVRAGAWLAVCWERLWPLLVPLTLVLMVFSGLSWLGVWGQAPVWLHLVILALIAVAAFSALLRLRQMSWPKSAEVTRRIEVETQLSDRPIMAQSDEIALGEDDVFSTALWFEHRQRMRKRLENLTGGLPKARGDQFDPYGLRLLLPVLVFVSFMISFGSDGGRLSDAFRAGGDPAKLLKRLDV